MATYENSITLARVFDGVDASSRNTIVLSAEEILKYPNTEVGAQSLTYAPAPLKLILKQDGNEIDVLSILDKLNISVEYIGIDEEEGVTISNLQDNNVKTLREYNEQKQGISEFLRGLLVYSYENNSLIFNINELNTSNQYFYQEVAKGQGQFKLIEQYDIIYDGNNPQTGWSFNKDIQYYIKNDDNAYQLATDFDENTSYYIKKILFNSLGAGETDGNYVQIESTKISHLIKLINNSDGFFRVVLSWDNEEAITAFSVRFAVSAELAKFSVHAAGINAAVGEAGLKFDGNGLTIENGNFKIVKTEGSETINLLYSENGDLVIKGKVLASSGEFRGKVIATEGEFKGTVIATEGTIGGFNITKNMISSEEGDIKLETEVGFLEDGTEYTTSKIIAANIELGSGANIADQINISDKVYLYNPTKHDGKVLVAGDTVLNSDGSLNIASVAANGWSVSESGVARFDKIIINSAEIGTSTLQVDTVQSVGGTMIFRPSYPVSELVQDADDNTKIWLTIDLPEDFSIGDNERIWLTCGNTKILTKIRVDDETHKYYIQENFGSDANFKNNETIVTLLGNNDLIFTISSKDSGVYNNDYIGLPTEDWIRSASLTLGEFTTKSADSVVLVEDNQESENQSDIFKYHLILGKLANNSYGLLADNVILNGSLTTKVMTYVDKDGKEHYTYAGVNTLGQATFNKSMNELNPDESKIVFWAGSKSEFTEDIQNAPFQVTEEGTLYAQQGYFKGSIITEANISASKITAAEFHGSTDNAALKLYDTGAGGIWFMNSNKTETDDLEDTISFIVKKDGFYIPGDGTSNYFINIGDDSSITIDVNKIIAPLAELNKININTDISTNGINFGRTTEGKFSAPGVINSDGTNLKIAWTDKSYLNISNDRIILNSSSTYINNELIIEKMGASKLQYKIVESGCDLYVLDEQKEEK